MKEIRKVLGECRGELHGISGAARKVGCAEDTLRVLERRGIICPQRDDAGRRLFSDGDIALARQHLRRGRARAPPGHV